MNVLCLLSNSVGYLQPRGSAGKGKPHKGACDGDGGEKSGMAVVLGVMSLPSRTAGCDGFFNTGDSKSTVTLHIFFSFFFLSWE